MARRVVRHKFRGKLWWILNNVVLTKANSNAVGECRRWSDTAISPALCIPIHGDTREDLDTIIHEALHACTELNEDAVEESAESIARLLWRLGWRKQD